MKPVREELDFNLNLGKDLTYTQLYNMDTGNNLYNQGCILVRVSDEMPTELFSVMQQQLREQIGD